MDSRTGEIYLNVTPEQMAKPDMIEIPAGELESVVNMNRHQRRAWAAQRRAEARQAAKGRP